MQATWDVSRLVRWPSRDDACMDQGLAGVVAGIVGTGGAVVGAAVGAIAGVRGARIGGVKAVEAALVQVERQAAVEHLQWVREQRQQACAKLLDAHSAAEDALKRAAAVIRRGGSFPDAERDELTNHIFTLQSCTSQLALWGPDEAVRLAQLLRAKTAEAAVALTQAQHGVADAAGDLELRWARWAEGSRAVTALRTSFLEFAGQVLRDPRQSST